MRNDYQAQEKPTHLQNTLLSNKFSNTSKVLPFYITQETKMLSKNKSVVMKKSFRALNTISLNIVAILFAIFISNNGFAQVYTFTNAGAIGRTGPTQAQLNTAYTSTPLAGQVTSINGIQRWIVPTTGTYRIEAMGAQGSSATSSTGGLGAYMSGEFSLTAGDTLHILVGQNAPNTAGRENLSSSGGGGTFITKPPHNTNGSILLIAGGGGGTGNERPATSNATTAQNGQTGSHGSGGTGGNGGTSGTSTAGAGAGFFTNGSGGGGAGVSYISGGFGGPLQSTYSVNGGGFGGGGSVTSGGNSRLAGGGGYSGGSGSTTGGSSTTGFWGGGGGSYNSGTNQVNASGMNSGHGMVIITFPAPTCLGVVGGTASSITGSSAALDWSSSSSSWQVQYGTSGFTLGTGTVTGVLTTKPHTISGLNSLTNYDFYVRNVCGPGDTSNWAGPYSFATICGITLSGTYTLNGLNPTGGTNFNSFADLAFALNNCGVSGAVTVNVASGTYTEQFNLGTITGASFFNTVTIQAATLDSTDVNLQFNTSTTNHIVDLDGTQHVTFKHMTIRTPTTTSGGGVINLRNGASNITFSNNVLQGRAISSTLTGYAIIFNNSTTTKEDNITISNNRILNGSSAVYMNSSTSTAQRNASWTINNNDISGFYQNGVYLYGGEGSTIQNNKMVTSSITTHYGVYYYSHYPSAECSGNDIQSTGSGAFYGIRAFYLYTTTSSRGRIHNNFISKTAGTGTHYGISLEQSNWVEVFHNSVNITSGSTSSRSFFLNGGSTNSNSITNNIFQNTGAGYASYVNTPTAVAQMDYNNYRATGTNLAFWSGNQTDLASLKSANGAGRDDNSLDVNPNFVSNTDLHCQSAILYEAGTPVGITTDIDGQARNATNPCIGADEFDLNFPCTSPPTAGTINVSSTNPCPGDQVTFTAPQATVGTGSYRQWQVSTVGASGPWNNTSAGDTNLVYSFNPSTGTRWYRLEVGCNSNTDHSSAIQINYNPMPLNGTYTINSSLAASSTNFQSFGAFVDELNCQGISGPVTVNVATGTYSEQIQLGAITGSSATNTVTFQSATGDSTDVILQFTSTSASNFVVRFAGANHITFRKMTIRTTSPTTGFGVVDITGGSSNIILENNVLQGRQNISGTSYFVINSSITTQAENNITIRNNRILNGAYGVYINTTTSTGLQNTNWVIENNHFENFFTHGFYGFYQRDLYIRGNYMITNSTTTHYGIYPYFSYGTNHINDNEIRSTGTGIFYGIYANYVYGTTGDRAQVKNNMIVKTAGTGSHRGIWFSQTSFVDFINNTVYISSGSTSSHGLYLNGGSSNSYVMRNNILVNNTAGYAAYFQSTTQFSEIDYNCYYKNGTTNLAYWGSARANLAALQTASGAGRDDNSVSVLPNFVSTSDARISGAKVLTIQPHPLVSTDIDGKTRCGITDIGASHTSSGNNDIGVSQTIHPNNGVAGVGAQDVIVVIQNFGANTVTSASVHYTDGTTTRTINWTGLLAPCDTAIITFTGANQYTFSGTWNMSFYTSLPNGTADSDNTNDTINMSGCVGMMGNYTIDASGSGPTNFTSFDAAITAMNSCGIAGSVHFAVAAGTYSGQIDVPAITGASASNTITFEGTSMAACTLSHATSTASQNYFIVRFNNSQHITFRNFTIRSTGSAGWLVHYLNGANNTVKNCRIEYSVASATSSNYHHVAINANTAWSTSHTTSTIANNHTIDSCQLHSSYYGIRVHMNNGANTHYITNNTMTAMYYYGVFVQSPSTMKIIGNSIDMLTPSITTISYGIYFSSCTPTGTNFHEITRNKVTNAGYFGLYMTSSNGSASNSIYGHIYNNMFGGGFRYTSGSTSGIYLTSSGRFNVYHNSILVDINNTSGTNYGIYVASGNNTRVHNNHIATTAGIAIPFFTNNTTAVQSLNSNNYFNATGSTLARINNVDFNQSNFNGVFPNGAGVNSFNKNPDYVSNLDLHTTNACTKGEDLTADVPTDFDGDTRSVPPSIGADEVTSLPNNDIGLVELISPSFPVTVGSHPVTVAVRNFGGNTVSSANLTYILGNNVPVNQSWTGTLLSCDSMHYTFPSPVSLSAGSYAFTAYTSFPNSSLDVNTNNDTINSQLCPVFNGTYTIGATGDFPTFGSAIAALQCGGMNGPVVFNVQSGTYTEQVEIPAITGASPTNTITFQSLTGNPNDVTLMFNITTTASLQNFVLRLNAAEYVHLRNFTISATSSTTAGTAVYIDNNASNDTLYNMTLNSIVTTSTSSNISVFRSATNTLSHYITLDSCRINNGSFGTYFYSSSSSTLGASSMNFTVRNCTLTNQYAYGMYNGYLQGLKIENNTIQTNSVLTSYRGIYNYSIMIPSDAQRPFIVGNHIKGASGGWGIHNQYVGVSSTITTNRRPLIANNMIQIGSGSSTSVGIYELNAYGADYIYNSVHHTSTNTSNTSVAGYFASTNTSTNNRTVLLNNVFASSGGAAAVRINNLNAHDIVNFNNLHTTGSVLAYQNTTARNTMNDWQSNTSFDANSKNGNPAFLSIDDLHSTSVDMFEGGFPTPLVLDDYDKQIRSTTAPCIGADEYMLVQDDAGIVSIEGLSTICSGSLPIGVRLRNYGLDPLNTVQIQWSVNNTPQTPLSFSGTLAPSQDTVLSLGNFTFSYNTNYTIVANTNLPNGVADQDNTNDTLTFNGVSNGLNGTYTVGGTSADFANLQAAVAALANGICGPVVFNFDSAAGPYIADVQIGVITGGSSTNTVTFNGNGSILNEGLTTSFFDLVGASYITINNFNMIAVNQTSNLFAILLRNQSEYITISNNTIDMGVSSTSTNRNGICATNSTTSYGSAGNNASYVTIDNNTIIGGYSGIRLNGTSSYLNGFGHVISNNVITDFYVYGIYLMDADSAIVHNNDISRPNRTTNYYGIYGLRARNTKITNNKVHTTTTTSTCYGIWVNTSQNTVGFETEIVNNLIYGLNTTNTAYPLYLSGTRDRINIHHNTVDMDGSLNGTKRAFFLNGAPNNHAVRNNIFSLRGTGGTGAKHLIYVSTTSASFSSNNNVYHIETTSGTNSVGYWTANRTSLNDWQTASSQDANAVSANPNYLNAANGVFIPLSTTIDDIGANVGVTTDIAGSPRSTTTPDAGAYEFTGANEDLALISASLINSLCYSNNDTLELILENSFGSSVDFSLNPINIGWSVQGPVNSSGTEPITSGSLALNDLDTIRISGVDLSQPGNYTYSLWIDSSFVNQTTFNDSLMNQPFKVDSIIRAEPKYTLINSTVDSVILEAKSPLFVSTQTYDIFSANLLNVTTGDTNTSRYTCTSNGNAGFQWVDNLPTNAVVTNVTLEFKIGVECSPGTRNTTFNSVAQSSFNSSTYYCSTTSPGVGDFITISMNPANYNAGGTNSFTTSGNTNCFGFERSALLNNRFARVTVEYTAGAGSFEWELNSATYDTNTTIVVGPYTSNGIYDYVAELVLGCGTYRDTGRVEVVLPGDDAGISQLVSPVNNGSCSGTQNVEVRVSNFGTNVLSSVNINWTLDATPQTPLNITGMNIQPGADTVIVLGTMSLSAISTSSVVAWTSNPNSAVDANAANDTLTANNITALLGGATYTIGATGNFTSFSNALTKLYQGVCGPVVFEVANGTYTEQVTIDTIPNVSSVNTVTFRSASGDSTSVIVQHAANAANFNWTLRLNGADYIRFERMTLRATGTSWGRVVEFINEADNNEITNCVIETNTTSTGSNFAGVWAANTSLNHNNRIANNRFIGGYYGVYFDGLGTGVTQRNIGLTIENNDFVDFYYYGVYIYYADAVVIHNNRLANRSNSNALYPMYLFYTYNASQITNNVIHSTNNGTNTYNGIYLLQSTGTTTQKALVANNVIAHTGTSTGTTYGLYTNGCSHVNILHNTVFLNNNPSTITNSRAYFNASGSNLTSINNIYHNESGGYAFYTSSTTAFITTDYNNFYTTGTNLAYWSTNRTTLAVLQANNGSRDQNSISEESKFIGATFSPDYPYALSDVSACIDAGTNTLPVTLSNDLRGSARILSGGAAVPTADMGAIEYILGEWNWEWTGAVNTVWSVGGNWNKGTPPGANQTASISSVPTNQPLVATNESINRLIVQSGASVTINAFSSLTVEDTIVNNGTITVEHSGSLIQTHTGTNNNLGSGTYVIKKTGNQQVNRYNVWSSPVVDTIKVWNVFTGTNPCDVYVFEPSTQSWKWPYPSGYQTTCMSSNVTFSASHVLTGMNGSMWAGRGYYVPGNGTNATRTFNGNVNNGTITTPVALGPNPTGAAWSGNNWNLVGNPYPSSINANDFWQENAVNNSRVSGALYFWNDNGTGSNYSENDYASWNTLGGVQGPNGGATPNGHVASGQGFWVIANSNTNVTFNNSMRSSVNNQFFGASETFPRIWIDVAFDTLVKSQALIAFPEDGTNDHDALYDAPKLQSNQQVYLASRINTQDLVIQGLEPLKFISTRKRVPLTFKTQLQGVHRIEMFNQDNMDRIAVYLHDAENDSLHPIQEASYVFTPDSVGEYLDRFALWFMHRDMDEHIGEIGIDPNVDNPSTGIANANDVRGFKVIARNEQIVIKSKGSSRIKHIVLTDMQGRTIREGDGKNGVRYELNTGRIATAIYFVRITDERGELSVEKIFIK